MAGREPEVGKLVRLIRKGATNKTMIEQGREFKVFLISGKGETAVAKKQRIFSDAGKTRPMSDEEFQQAREKTRQFMRQHGTFEKALGKSHVPLLLEAQMRVDRPGAIFLQRRVPVLLRQRNFQFRKGQWTPVSVRKVPPKFMAAVLPDIIHLLVKADKAGVPLDFHLGNWLVKTPRGKSLEEVARAYSKGRKKFRVYYCDTFHKMNDEWAALENSVPIFLKSVKLTYPKDYKRLERIAFNRIRRECGDERARKIFARKRVFSS